MQAEFVRAKPAACCRTWWAMLAPPCTSHPEMICPWQPALCVVTGTSTKRFNNPNPAILRHLDRKKARPYYMLRIIYEQIYNMSYMVSQICIHYIDCISCIYVEYTYIQTYMHTYICIYIHTNLLKALLCIYVHMCIRIQFSVYIYIHIHIYLYDV